MGLAHRKDKLEGTLAQHLSADFEITTALAGDSEEVKSVLLQHAENSKFSSKSNVHPFHVPNIIVANEDRVIAQMPEFAEEGTIEALLIEERDSYCFDNPHLKNAPFPTVANNREVRKSIRYMKDERIQTALGNLSTNEPWAELIAKSRGAEQDAERG